MIVLSLSKKIQKLIGIYRENESDPMKVVYMSVMNVVFLLGMLSVLVIGSLVFMCMNLSDLRTSTNAMVIMMAGCSGVGCYCGIASNLKSTQKLYTILQHIADESNLITN